MVKPLGYYTGYTPGDDESILGRLQERYGATLNQLNLTRKLIFRAALCNYLALKPVWADDANSISCMEACIEGAGADYDIWDEDPELCRFIEECDQLKEGDIEGLIEALSNQIRSKCYAEA